MAWSLADVLSRRGFLRAAAGAVLASPLLLDASTARADSNCCIDVSGRWTCGSWRSYCNGHHGRLSGVLQRNECGDYRCRFTGTFAKIIPFLYPVTLQVVACDDKAVYFRGSKRLIGLGSFCYEGHATCCSFQFTYTTKKDRGIFQMSR
jgi:hypothetical protein